MASEGAEASIARALGAAEALRESLAMSELRAARSAFSGTADRYCRPAITAAASRAENRGEPSIATRWVSTISSSSSNESHEMSKRSPCWYSAVSPGTPLTAIRRTASRICSGVIPKCSAAALTETRSWSTSQGTKDSRNVSLSRATSGGFLRESAMGGRRSLESLAHVIAKLRR